MKGVVFNLLEEAVGEAHGEQAWDHLLELAGVDGAYTSLGSYPDEEMAALVGAASGALDATPAEVLRWFGRDAMPRLAQRYPMFFEQQPSLHPFLMSLNGIIHPEVRKLYAGAHCPVFRFDTDPGGALLIGYQSPRRLCRLAEGFIEGAADHYREAVDVAHVQCMHNGDPRCVLRVELL